MAVEGFDWSSLVPGFIGMLGGGGMMKMLIQRQLSRMDVASEDIHVMKTDIAVIKEKIHSTSRLDDKVSEMQSMLAKIQGHLAAINKKGCDFAKDGGGCGVHSK